MNNLSDFSASYHSYIEDWSISRRGFGRHVASESVPAESTKVTSRLEPTGIGSGCGGPNFRTDFGPITRELRVLKLKYRHGRQEPTDPGL
jgi:hypothetical protein